MARQQNLPSGKAEGFEHAAATLKLLVQLDQRAQERLKSAELTAQQLLDSVGEEVAKLEAEAEEQLRVRLEIFNEEQEQMLQEAILAAEMRYSKAYQLLNQQYRLHRSAWLEEIVRRVRHDI